MKFRRRDIVLSGAGAAVAASAGRGIGIERFNELFSAYAQPPKEEHRFLFIELKGGIHWSIATDGRDPSLLNLSDAARVTGIELNSSDTATALSLEAFSALIGKGAYISQEHGNHIVLPFIGSVQDSYTKGTTNIGADYIMGFAGNPLLPHVNDIAVVRGVKMWKNFHGDSNKEIFNGSGNNTFGHIGGHLSSLLSVKLGPLLLDNIVMEGAEFNFSADSNGGVGNFMLPSRLDFQTLGNLFGAESSVNISNSQDYQRARFQRAIKLSEDLKNYGGYSSNSGLILAAFISALQKAPELQKQILPISDRFANTDASLDLDLQCDATLTLFQAGLTRVASLCLGASNGKNMVDGFGLFDCHQGLYHSNPNDSKRSNTHRHQRNVRNAMQSLANLIQQLKLRKDAAGKTLWETTTVVVGTEFARPSNLMGNEANGGTTENTGFGNGHYSFNNNYILFGKGIRGGAWIGKNHPVTQLCSFVDTSGFLQKDITKLQYSDYPLQTSTDANLILPSMSADLLGKVRPIFPADVLRTVLASAGFENRYSEFYSGNAYDFGVVLSPLLS